VFFLCTGKGSGGNHSVWKAGSVKPFTGSGMYFKVPFNTGCQIISKSGVKMEWNGDTKSGTEPRTKSSFLWMTYARWQITDPLQFLND